MTSDTAAYLLIFTVATVVGWWQIFDKAGRPGVAALVPIYNLYVICKVARQPGWWWVFMLIPITGPVVWVVMNIQVARAFGRSTAFGFGMALIPFVFAPILGFSGARYLGASDTARTRRGAQPDRRAVPAHAPVPPPGITTAALPPRQPPPAPAAVPAPHAAAPATPAPATVTPGAVVPAPELATRLDRLERQLEAFQAEIAELRTIAAAVQATPAPTTEPETPPAPPEVSVAAPTAPGYPPAAPARPAPVAEPTPTRPREAVGPTRWERATAFASAELSGGRAFAVIGGAVMLLGIIFLFILAANRGWIGPVSRVAIGGIASVAVFGAGILLRSRYGRLNASLAAAGTGIAGAYATTAAATSTYHLIPNWAGLLVAAAIAAAGGVLGVRWDSQILAGLSLIGAALAPGLVEIGRGFDAPGTAFALLVFAAAIATAAPRRWSWLLAAVGAGSLGQVVGLAATATPMSSPAIAVVAATSALLLAGSMYWQGTAGATLLDPIAGWLMLLGGACAFPGLMHLIPAETDAGVALLIAAAVYAIAALAIARIGWRDLAWTAGAVALVLAGIATTYLLSRQALTAALGIEAAGLALLAWRTRQPRFEGAGLVFLAAGVGHAFVVDAWLGNPHGDLAGASATGLLILAAAALAVGVFALDERADAPTTGVLAGMEAVWDGLLGERGTLRLWLWVLTVILAAFGTAAATDGRWVTIPLAVIAIILAVAARRLGERRLQAMGLAFLTIAAGHALAVDATAGALGIARGDDALAPVPSLIALCAAAAVAAAAIAFPTRGIAWLGPLDGQERALEWIRVHARAVQTVLAVFAATYAVWALGLIFIWASYDLGQVLATTLWSAVGVAAAAVAARRRSAWLGWAALAPVLFACGKAIFDANALGDRWGGAAGLIAASGLLVAGFLLRYATARTSWRVEFVCLATGAVAVVQALSALDLLLPNDPHLWGVTALIVAAAVGALSAYPFRAWRAGSAPGWSRDLATMYWGGALAVWGGAWIALTSDRWHGGALLVTAWAVSAVIVVALAEPLSERRLWIAGFAWSVVAALGCIIAVVPPDRLWIATAHPADDLWALAACVVAVGWSGVRAPDLGPLRIRIVLGAVALTLYGLSLAVLELVQWISTASVQTDFERGQTAVSAAWAALALAAFVYGLVAGNRVVERIGLAMFGLALVKLFLYDLQNLNSITRAVSFLAVGGVLLTAAFFAERIVGRRGPPDRDGARPA